MQNSLKYEHNGSTVTIFLSGRLSSSNAAETEAQIKEIISSAGDADYVIDASELEYISSAGLRVLMRLRKKDGETDIINVSPQVYDIFEITGFNELFNVSRKMREVSVEGCEVIGRGFFGTVYRIDEETIVKVYASPDSLSMIKNEKRLAKTALVAGVPTAISYDIVRVGNSYGSVFELLNAKTFNDKIVSEPENAESIIEEYAKFLRFVNSTEVPVGKLVSAKGKFFEYLDVASKYLSDEVTDRIRALTEEIPEENFIIHGDAQMKNIMLTDSGPMLIDMDTLSAGHPVFDLQSLYVTYFAFGEDEPENSMNFLGMPQEMAARIWGRTIAYYFDTEDENRLSELRDKISIAGCVRFLFLLDFMDGHDTDLFKARIKHTVERLERLTARVDTLLF